MQRRVVGVLNGKGRRSYAGSGPLTTSELLEEVRDAGFLEDAERRHALSSLRRACRSLAARGLVACEGLVTVDGGHEEVSWAGVRSTVAPG